MECNATYLGTKEFFCIVNYDFVGLLDKGFPQI